MTIDHKDSRQFYRPSGRVNWPRFLRWAAFPVAFALAMAFVLNCFPLGFWGSVATAAGVMVSLPAAGIAAIAGGQCRNQWVAILLVEATGAVFLVGCHALAFLNPLPGKPDWQGLALLHVVLFCPYTYGAVLTSIWATHAYCEACGCWMRRQRVMVPARTAVPLAAALMDGTLAALDAVSVPAVAGGGAHAEVDLEYCPKSVRGEFPCPAYLTLKEKNRETKQAAEKESDVLYFRSILHASPHRQKLQYDPHSGSRFVVRQMEISPLEVAILAAKIPPLIVAVTPSSASMVTSLTPGQSLEVEPFFRRLVHDLLSYTAVFLVLAGTAVAAWGYCERPWAGGLAGPAGWLAWIKLGSGGVAALLGSLICAINIAYFSRRYRYCWVREAIQWRADRIVDPDEPDAIFVQVVPRAKWERSGCHPDDMGFLRLDCSGRELLFEGVRQRYRISADALTYCAIEPVTYDGRPNWPYLDYVTVIRVLRLPSPSDASMLPWEVPLLVESVNFRSNGKRHRHRRAVELRDQIVDAMKDHPSRKEWRSGDNELRA